MKSVLFLVVVLLAASPWAQANPSMDTAAAAQSAMVNINTASATALADALVGVGEKKAQAIVEYRQQHGEFEAIDQLERVKGIGAELVSKNRSRIQL